MCQAHTRNWNAGSSPLARGLLGAVQGGAGRGRIIPARAGFTASTSPSPRRSSDHPRSRGVYGGFLLMSVASLGSSPLARGLRVLVDPLIEGLRIIPARAGFTRPVLGQRDSSSDHPRSRGVYGMVGVTMGGAEGSSPLARGLLKTAFSNMKTGRIIPARAGFTCSTRSARSPQEDHPRSRGVYCDPRPRRRDVKGSSPLARGLHPYHYSGELRHGIIPARAGFTPPGTR